MEIEFVKIVAMMPDMSCWELKVRKDSWEHFCDHHLNYPDPGNCFLPCKGADDKDMFIDMTKLVGFSVVAEEKPKKETKKKSKSKKNDA